MSFLGDLRFFTQVSVSFWRGLRFQRDANPSITIFGSARLPSTHPYCLEAKKLGHALAASGYTVVTGGGGAIMQAANEGAHRAGGESIGIHLDIFRENSLNPFVKRGHRARYFFIRKVLLARNSRGFVVFPGGFGTLDELFEMVTLAQTGVSPDHPILLMHAEFWQGFIAWCRDVMVPAGMIHEAELARLRVINCTEDALVILRPG